MKEFPEKFVPANYLQFSQYRYDRNLLYFRQEVYEFALEGNEDEAFDIKAFELKFRVKAADSQKMVATIIQELHAKGWATKLAFADTGLFIYRDAKKPPKRVSDAL